MRKSDKTVAKTNKICEICGNKGVGRNFGAITCESCKAFFRRNSLKNKTFKCKFDYNCDIDYTAKRLCKKCRLDKCLSVGMKKEFIQSAKQKELRKIAIEDNKKIGKNDRKAAIDGNKSVTDKTPSNGEIGSKDDVFAKIFDNNKRVYNDVIALNRCIVENLDNRPPKLDQNQKQLFQHLFAPLLQPINVYKDWTDGEHQWVSDLCLTSNVFEEKYTEKCIEVQNIHHFYELWGNRIENDTKNIVTFTKGLTQGTDICHNDQIALVKYSSMELIVLRANHFYDDRAQTWTCNVNNEYSFITPMNVLKLEKRDLYNSYKVYLDKILPEWNRDTVILNLLSAIVLFNPERPNMINPKAVKAKRDMYLYLLQRYLMIKYRWEWQWRAKMSSLMNALNDLQHVSQIEIQNGIEEYFHYFGPVFREILVN